MLVCPGLRGLLISRIFGTNTRKISGKTGQLVSLVTSA